MTLFCAAVKRNLVSLLKFPLLSDVHIISLAIYLVGHLKYPYSFFFPFVFSRLLLLLLLLLLMIKIYFLNFFLRLKQKSSLKKTDKKG